MQHLLAFFKESSRHLDPKTRFLISIVTKVVNFSPRGLRQYIPRAVREGASPDEVMDAILCAYPAAGLTRVVDAIDVLRSLDLVGGEKHGERGAPGDGCVSAEEGPPGAPGDDAAEREWVPVLRVGELVVNGTRVIGTADRPLQHGRDLSRHLQHLPAPGWVSRGGESRG